ncbi:MAG: DUF3570 domain-containing protein [Polyangiaceae bacterium]
MTVFSHGAAAQEPPPQETAPDTTPPPSDSRSDINVKATSDFATYADTDHVFVQTPSIAGAVSNPNAGWSLDGSYLVDVVSAASVDIVSTASRRWEEVRQAGVLNAAYKPSTLGASASANVSSEPDYLSWTAGGAVTQDLFAKNFTWLFGFYHSHDIAGRTGTPFSTFSHALDREAFKGGATLVLDRATLASFVGDVIVESGDPSKPYRYIPLFAPGTNVPKGAPIDLVQSLRASARPLEQLPLHRDRFAGTFFLEHRFARSTLRGDERLYIDTWSLKATSTDARFLFDASRRVETGPHARFHAQTSVNFWQRAYTLGTVASGFDYPALRTGDRELGPLVNVTGGWTLRIGVGSDPTPKSWVLGFDANLTSTRYLDDLYVTSRISAVGGVSLEASL